MSNAHYFHWVPGTTVMAPGDHRKTTLLNIEWWVWRILTWPDLNIRGCLIMHRAEKAWVVVDAVRKILEHGLPERAPELRQAYGEFKGVRWARGSITIAQRTQMELKEPTLAGFGFGPGVTSGHYDVTVIDDPITLEDTRTAYMRGSAVSVFQMWIVAALGEVHVVGHPWWPGEFYDYLKENHLATGYRIVGNKMVKEGEDAS